MSASIRFLVKSSLQYAQCSKFLPRQVAIYKSNGVFKACVCKICNYFSSSNSTLVADENCSLNQSVLRTNNEKQADSDVLTFKEKEKLRRLDALKNLSQDDEKRLKTLQIEYDVWMSLGKQLPNTMTDEMWSQLLFECPTISSRSKIYWFWYKREKGMRSQELKKQERAKRHEEHISEIRKREASEGSHMKNTIFIHIYNQSMVQHYNNNLCHAMLFGCPLVFDLSFEEQMRKQDIVSLAEQLQQCHGLNKIARHPFHFNFCNVDTSSLLWHCVKNAIPNIDSLPLTTSKHHYLDLFPEERLVYLTPNAPYVLDRFNPDDVYIVGGLVDKTGTGPITLPKAKKEGIRTAKFPLDQVLR